MIYNTFVKRLARIISSRSAIVLTITLVMGASVGILVRQFGDSAPIHFDKTTVDFGDIRPEGRFQGVVTFTNRSSRDVSVVRMASSCACLAGSSNAVAIQPGETSEIQIDLTTPQSSTKPLPLMQHLTVEFDHGLPAVRIFVRAVVQSELYIEPHELVFCAANDGLSTLPVHLIVRRGGMSAAEFAQISLLAPGHYRISAERVEVDAKAFIIELAANAPSALSPIRIDFHDRDQKPVQTIVPARIQEENLPSVSPVGFFRSFVGDNSEAMRFAKSHFHMAPISSQVRIVSIEASSELISETVAWELISANDFTVWVTKRPSASILKGHLNLRIEAVGTGSFKIKTLEIRVLCD